MLQVIAEHGQVVHRAEGGWVLELQRQALVEEILAGLVEGEAGMDELEERISLSYLGWNLFNWKIVSHLLFRNFQLRLPVEQIPSL